MQDVLQAKCSALENRGSSDQHPQLLSNTAASGVLNGFDYLTQAVGKKKKNGFVDVGSS